eukprot:gene15075-1080_t
MPRPCTGSVVIASPARLHDSSALSVGFGGRVIYMLEQERACMWGDGGALVHGGGELVLGIDTAG